MKSKNSIVDGILGETADVPAPEDAAQDLAPDPQVDGTEDASQPESPQIDNLVAIWDSGEKKAVAIRVLDALDSYQQFVDLLFRIGQEGALELGGIMDELTASEKSAHEYDTVPVPELATKYGKGPQPGPATHAATGEGSVGESTVSRITGQRSHPGVSTRE